MSSSHHCFSVKIRLKLHRVKAIQFQDGSSLRLPRDTVQLSSLVDIHTFTLLACTQIYFLHLLDDKMVSRLLSLRHSEVLEIASLHFASLKDLLKPANFKRIKNDEFYKNSEQN